MRLPCAQQELVSTSCPHVSQESPWQLRFVILHVLVQSQSLSLSLSGTIQSLCNLTLTHPLRWVTTTINKAFGHNRVVTHSGTHSCPVLGSESPQALLSCLSLRQNGTRAPFQIIHLINFPSDISKQLSLDYCHQSRSLP